MVPIFQPSLIRRNRTSEAGNKELRNCCSALVRNKVREYSQQQNYIPNLYTEQLLPIVKPVCVQHMLLHNAYNTLRIFTLLACHLFPYIRIFLASKFGEEIYEEYRDCTGIIIWQCSGSVSSITVRIFAKIPVV